MRTTLAFAGGYTAGHITPGLAVIEWLRTHGPAGDFLFFGANDGWEKQLVAQAAVRFVGVPATPWTAQPLATRGLALVRLAPAIFAARRALREAGTTHLIGLGSFASVAPALAARSLGLPVTLYEPNANLGLANRLLRKRARALLTSRLLLPEFARDAAVVEVGVPLRASVGALIETAKAPGSPPRLLVLGGSRGNPFLNEKLPAVAGRLRATLSSLSVTHQCGHDVAPAPVAAAYAAAGLTAQVEPYFGSIATQLRAADFIVSAAGAITLHELATTGVPSLIVPLDSGGGAHQQHNAAAFSRLTGSPCITPAQWDEGAVAAEIALTFSQPARWRERQAGLRALSDPLAAERFTAAILAHHST